MPHIRPIAPEDIERCVEFGLEAFRPVFASFREHYGEGLFHALRPNWEDAQSGYIREATSDAGRDTWVAVLDTEVVGFAVLEADHEAGLGRIELMAVDPEHQNRGVGTALTEFAVGRFRELGMAYAVVGTGDDPGHAPARKTYRKGGFEPMAIQPLLMKLEL